MVRAEGARGQRDPPARRVREPRRPALPRRRPVRHPPGVQPVPHVRPRHSLLPRRGARAAGGARRPGGDPQALPRMGGRHRCRQARPDVDGPRLGIAPGADPLRKEVTMPGRVEGKVAFSTGAARGQGRSHAVRLAQEGADIIAVDICRQIRGVPFPMSTPEDLAETVKEVEALDRRIVATQADVRDYDALRAAVDDGVAQLGRLDRPDLKHPTRDDFAPVSQMMHALPVPWVEPVDISNAVLFLASDEARYVTGVTLPIDAGVLIK